MSVQSVRDEHTELANLCIESHLMEEELLWPPVHTFPTYQATHTQPCKQRKSLTASKGLVVHTTLLHVRTKHFRDIQRTDMAWVAETFALSSWFNQCAQILTLRSVSPKLRKLNIQDYLYHGCFSVEMIRRAAFPPDIWWLPESFFHGSPSGSRGLQWAAQGVLLVQCGARYRKNDAKSKMKIAQKNGLETISSVHITELHKKLFRHSPCDFFTDILKQRKSMQDRMC